MPYIPKLIPNRNYSWIIVVSAFFYCVIWSGFGYYVFSVFVKPLQSEFGWDRSIIMIGFLVWSLTNGIAGVFVGRAVDRFHPKRVMLVGSGIICLGFLGLSHIQSIIQFYLSYIIVGIGIAAIGQVPCSALISEWFEKKRGLAIGIMSVGVGLGGLIAPALTSGVLIPILGWRLAYLGLGIIAFVITFPIALLVIKPNPNRQTFHLTIGEKKQTTSNLIDKSNSLRNRYMFSPLLWLIAVSFLFSQFGLTGTLQNQVPHMTDVGFSPIAAASILGMIGLFSSLGKLFVGWLCDFIQVRYVFIITVLLQASGTSILLTLTPDTPIIVKWIYAFSIGIGGGTWLPIMSMYISHSFPIKHYGTLFGVVNFCFSIGVACGPLFAGFLFDIYGNYNLAFKIFLGIYTSAIIMGFFSKSSTKERI